MGQIKAQLTDAWEFLTKRGAWRPMLTVHIAVLLLSALLFTPITAATVRTLVSLSGRAALSDTEIASFLLNPAGAIAALAITSIALTIAILDYAALMTTAWALHRGEPATLMATAARIRGTAPALVKLALRLILRCLAAALPFIAGIGATYWGLLRHNDINYYLAEQPPEFITAVIIATLLLIALGVVLIQITVSWFYALPLVLFRHESSKQAKAHSEETTKGQRKAIAMWLGLWIFGTPILISLLNSPLTFGARWLIPHLRDHLPALSLALGSALVLTTTLSFLTGFATLSLLAYRNVRMFAAAGLDLPTTDSPKPEAKPHVPLGEKSLLALAALVLLFSGALTYRWLGQIQMRDETLIIAHRGASATAPENTMAAIYQALEDGAHWVEIDVQETADGEIVLFHDSDFKRVGRTALNIWDAQSSDLDQIEIGSWFAPEFASETTPTLRQALEACRNRAGVLIELKYYGHDEMLEQRVINIVEDLQMVDQVMIMSLQRPGIEKVRQLRPDWKIGLLSSVAVGDLTRLDVDFLGLNARAATKPLIERAHRAGIDVFVWTVNDPISMSSLTSRGADGLITDKPALARDVLQQRKDLNPGERLLLELAHIFGSPSRQLEQ
ncbi:glycerophosphodiester phosphodiesterase family protein [Sulfuriroseicoccus oceanibius]|uniref:Glycerophosphoryl diester phosphodiesterase membrane domain-containing protein n=1 Tax=Sulfuriroseicoccus oceanibius TaxID=2707525 RepID=A0A6B3L2L7_9BACT|nr:glycerophosphodiester phosphodiesterase family protein [Sulfuriroseicoccus oceanibius]QQL44362.1 glycerophosphoryl diester phosphodiesterase membrane domain-containing protein [Sulfuriroseicoccus oceanibius]